jgi:aminoglycoside phosphotransferase (APT) family kinase protein
VREAQPGCAVIEHGGRRLFVKADPPAALRREWAVLHALRPLGVAPAPVLLDAEAGFLVQEYVAGGRPGAAALGAALAAVHAAAVDGSAADSVQDEYQDIRQRFSRAAPAARADPRARPLLALVAGIAAGAKRAGQACRKLPPCLIHGDLTPGNVRDAGSRAVLVDWECARRSSPLIDLAAARLRFPEEAPGIIRAYAPLRKLDAETLTALAAEAAPLAALIEGVQALEAFGRGEYALLDDAVACLRGAMAL